MKNTAKFLFLVFFAALMFMGCDFFEVENEVFAGTTWKGTFLLKDSGGAITDSKADAILTFKSTVTKVSGTNISDKDTPAAYKNFTATYGFLTNTIEFTDVQYEGDNSDAKKVFIAGTWNYKITNGTLSIWKDANIMSFTKQ